MDFETIRETAHDERLRQTDAVQMMMYKHPFTVITSVVGAGVAEGSFYFLSMHHLRGLG